MNKNLFVERILTTRGFFIMKKIINILSVILIITSIEHMQKIIIINRNYV